jgi:hypothetical protein
MGRTIAGAVLSPVGLSSYLPVQARRSRRVAETAVGYIRIMDPAGWKALPYDAWAPTCDTLHAHAQLLGKLAVALAPPEPQLQHAALRLTARGWETLPLPAPDGSGALVVTLDLQRHENVVEHSDGRVERIALGPNRAVGEVTRDVLGAVGRMVGPVRINATPQEVSWTAPLDEDDEHTTYEPDQVAVYFAAATRAALVLAALRAPYRGRCSPVNAWWGTFDLAVSLYSGLQVDPPSQDFIMRNAGSAQQIEVGWWPGDPRHPMPAFFGFASPAPDGFAEGSLTSGLGAWSEGLGEFILEWDDVITTSDPHTAALEFAQAVVAHACLKCSWDPALAASAQGDPPPVR